MPVSLPPGGNKSSWSGPWRAASTPAGTEYYYNGTTGNWRQYNSKTNTTTQLSNTTSPTIDQATKTFQSKVNNAIATANGAATTATSTAASGGATSTVAPSTSAGPTTRTGRSRASASGNPYYPADLATTKQDRIKFTRRKPAASRGGLVSSTDPKGGFGVLGGRTAGAEDGIVFLGIQGQIVDGNGADWSGMTISPLQLKAAQMSLKAMKDPGFDLAGAAARLAGDAAKEAKNLLSKYGAEAQIYLAQEAVQAQGLLSRFTGKVANPNLELLFTGPTLRNFSFQFRMSPRDAAEAQNVKRIIRFFKKGLAPIDTEDKVFLNSPCLFDVQYQSGETNTPHPSLPKIKTCALISCEVNYTPDGSYMTFDDAANGYPMTCYEMSLRFSELAPIYASDYGDTADNSATDIGY